MKNSFFRAVKFAFQDFWRNIWLSIVTVTVLVLALLSVNILISLNAVSNSVVTSVEEKIDVSIFFKPDIMQAQINNFSEKMKAMPEVKDVIYISRDEALADFKKKHINDKAIMEALQEVEENPLLDALVIKANSTEDYEVILSRIQSSENQEIIKHQNYTDHEKIISRVNVISNKVEKIGWGLTAIFAIIAVLIVFNAIKVTIYTHREEIAVMRLVGASNSFIRSPFTINSIIYAISALIVTIILIYVILGATGPYLSSFLDTYNFNLVEYYNQNFVVIFVSELVFAVILSMFSSSIAIGRYLKV